MAEIETYLYSVSEEQAESIGGIKFIEQILKSYDCKYSTINNRVVFLPIEASCEDMFYSNGIEIINERIGDHKDSEFVGEHILELASIDGKDLKPKEDNWITVEGSNFHPAFLKRQQEKWENLLNMFYYIGTTFHIILDKDATKLSEIKNKKDWTLIIDSTNKGKYTTKKFETVCGKLNENNKIINLTFPDVSNTKQKYIIRTEEGIPCSIVYINKKIIQLFNIPNVNSKNLLDYVIKYIESGQEEFENFIEKRKVALENLEKEKFSNACKSIVKNTERFTARSIDRLEHDLNELRGPYLQALKSLTYLREFKSKTSKDLEGFFEKQFESIKQIKKVNSFYLEENKLIIETTDLHFTDRAGQIHLIGQVKISIPAALANLEEITYTNISFPDIRHPIPHSYGQGQKACYGNAEIGINDLLANMEFAGLINYLIAFCEHANEDDQFGQEAVMDFEIIGEE